jgi:hypothetical protein
MAHAPPPLVWHSSGDWISNLDVHIPNLLANKIRVLVYSGMLGMFVPPPLHVLVCEVADCDVCCLRRLHLQLCRR